MRILIKQNDKHSSELHSGRFIPEYLIYLMNGDMAIECFNEVGDKAKKERVNELILTHFVTDNWTENNIIVSDIVTEVSYEEFKQQI